MRGNIEKYDNGILYGWVDGRANSISFNVFVNDIRIGTLTPTILRKDVLQDLKVETEYPMGFEFALNMSNIHIKKHIKICCSTDHLKCLTYIVPEEVCTKSITNFFSNFNFTNVTIVTSISQALEQDDIVFCSSKPSITTIKHLQYSAYTNTDTHIVSFLHENLIEKSLIFIKQNVLFKFKHCLTIQDIIMECAVNGYRHLEIRDVNCTKQYLETVYNNKMLEFSDSLKSNSEKHYLCNVPYDNKNILFILSNKDGGTPHTTRDLIQYISKHYTCTILHANENGNIELFKVERDCSYTLVESYVLNTLITPYTHSSTEYDNILIDILYRHSISLLHIRHICWHSLGITRCAQYFNIPIVYSLHDYYSLCPSHNLLDQDNQYCAGKCSASCTGSRCSTVLWGKEVVPPLKNVFITTWQKRFNIFLNQCDILVTTSTSVVNIFKSVLDIKTKFQIIEHGRTFTNNSSYNKKYFFKNKKIKIIVPGILTSAKGLEEIEKLKSYDTHNILDIIFVGEQKDSKTDSIGAVYGVYERDKLSDIINEIKPDVALILSIWPETYCHTLTEMWSNGIPTIVYNYGAQAERSRTNNLGFVVQHDYKQVYDLLYKLYTNPKLLKQASKDISNYNIKTIEEMSQEYLSLYDELYYKKD